MRSSGIFDGLAALGLSISEEQERGCPMSEPTRALEGLRVIDLATFLAAPFCGTLLADFGAEVVKIEDPERGDSLRALGQRWKGEGTWWLQEGRNKETITCNLRDERGQELVRRLCADADIVLENFRPGTMERWHLGYEELSAANPKLVMVRVSAFGQDGPLREQPGFGRIAQAFGGITYLSGFPDRPPVVPGSAAVADYTAGLFAAFGAMVAYRSAQETGSGQVVDVSLFESVFRMLDTLAIDFAQAGIVRERAGVSAPHAAPHSHYDCGDGAWIAIACTNNRMFERLAGAIDQPGLAADPRFATGPDRVAHRDELDAHVSDFCRSMPREEVLARLEEHEVPSAPIYSIADAFADAQYKAREAIVTYGDPELGELTMTGVQPRLSDTPGRIRHAGRPLGADNDEVYGRLLGLDAQTISDYREAGVI
jgi:crotonobetainyl-CoA:carnitine CoA-transferase CaiB-like acyl-CoA transferase